MSQITLYLCEGPQCLDQLLSGSALAAKGDRPAISLVGVRESSLALGTGGLSRYFYDGVWHGTSYLRLCLTWR